MEERKTSHLRDQTAKCAAQKRKNLNTYSAIYTSEKKHSEIGKSFCTFCKAYYQGNKITAFIK